MMTGRWLRIVGIVVIGCAVTATGCPGIDDDGDSSTQVDADDASGASGGDDGGTTTTSDATNDATSDADGATDAGGTTDPDASAADAADSTDTAADGSVDGADTTPDSDIAVDAVAPSDTTDPPADASGEDTPTDVSDSGPADAEGSGDAPPDGPCIGAPVDPGDDEVSAGDPLDCPTCIDSPWPQWRLVDFQPQSCGYERIYGLEEFRGTVTFVALLSAGCGFCLSQTVYLEQMRLELEGEGHDLDFALVNRHDQSERQSAMTERASFPMFQDIGEGDAWDRHGGHQDDFYVYGAGGALFDYLPAGAERSNTLSTEEGYANVKNAILAALAE